MFLTDNELDARQEAERDYDARAFELLAEGHLAAAAAMESVTRATEALAPLLAIEALASYLLGRNPKWHHAYLVGQSGAAVVSEEPTT